MPNHSGPSFQSKFKKERAVFLVALYFFLNLGVLSSFLAPFPLVLLYLLYGRKLRLVATLLIAFVGIGITLVYSGPPFTLYSFLFSSLIAYGFSEIIYRKIPPMRGIIMLASLCIGVFFLILGGMELYFDAGLKGILVESLGKLSTELASHKAYLAETQGEKAREFFGLLESPEKFVDELLFNLPLNVFVGLLVSFWFNMYLILKNRVLGQSFFLQYPYGVSHLIRFKVPEVFIWPFIVFLALAVFGDYLYPQLNLFGEKALLFLAPFYLFHGLGIFLDFLKVFGIRGFFHSLLMILTVLFAYWILILVGLLDIWINFRKYIGKMKKS